MDSFAPDNTLSPLLLPIQPVYHKFVALSPLQQEHQSANSIDLVQVPRKLYIKRANT